MTLHTYKFENEHVDAVQRGEKTATVRLGDHRRLDPRDFIFARTPDGEKFATLKVTGVARCQVQHAPTAVRALRGGDGCALVAELRDALREHYDRPVGREETATVIVFELFETEGPSEATDAEVRDAVETYSGP